MKWWAYVHTNGELQVKRYHEYRDITEAWASPFVATVLDPIEADSREEAIREFNTQINEGDM
jgi:hypothetical protein